jgi:CDGSH-type Zn-finger protein
MAADEAGNAVKRRRIVIIKDGPYSVEGGIPLVTKTQVAASQEEYQLCRCGRSSSYPFCDDTHKKVAFDGAETAETGPTERRASKFPRGSRIIVKKDATLCMDSGYCGLRDAGMSQLVAATKDSKMRSLVMAMVERCLSGALTYRIEEGEPDIEPDLPQQIAVTTEITSDGPIAGPLWVTGGIPVERSDGQPFETRNRVTLCNCGQSSRKPLCDGTHRALAQREARRRRIFG